MVYEAKNIRNVALFGHQGSGKTSLVESLYAAVNKTEKGSIEKGKDADVIAIDLGNVDTLPIYDPASQLLYSAGREDITHVWVDGKLVVKKQQSIGLQPLTREKAQKITKTWQNRI